MDCAEAEEVAFTVQDSTKIGRKYWKSVRQNKLTLSQTTGGNNGTGLVVSVDSGTKTKKKKKKPNKKGTSPKQLEEETDQAAPKTEDKKGPQNKNTKESYPVYCLCCSCPSHQARDCDKKGDRVCQHHADSKSYLTEAFNITRQAQGLPVHPYLLRPSHSGNRAELELDSDFEGHLDDSVSLFSDNPQSPEHTGCHVTMECPDLTEDKREYKSSSSSAEEADSEPGKSRDLGKPFRKVLRQSRGGRNKLRKGGSDDKITGSIRLTEYMSYKASDTDTPSYSLLVLAKSPTPTTAKKLAPTKVLLDTGASISLLPLWKACQLGVEVKRKEGIRVWGQTVDCWTLAGWGTSMLVTRTACYRRGSQ